MSWPVYVFVAATLFSLPARTRKVCSARCARLLSLSLVMPMVKAPAALARFEHHIRVGRFAGLRDRDDDGIFEVHSRFVKRENGRRG